MPTASEILPHDSLFFSEGNLEITEVTTGLMPGPFHAREYTEANMQAWGITERRGQPITPQEIFEERQRRFRHLAQAALQSTVYFYENELTRTSLPPSALLGTIAIVRSAIAEPNNLTVGIVPNETDGPRADKVLSAGDVTVIRRATGLIYLVSPFSLVVSDPDAILHIEHALESFDEHTVKNDAALPLLGAAERRVKARL